MKEDEYEPEGEEDQEAWAKAVAAEFADQDAATKAKEEEDKAKAADAEQEAVKKVFSAPGKVNMSLAEGRALFKVSLFFLTRDRKLIVRACSSRRTSRHSHPGTSPFHCSSTIPDTFCSGQ